MSRMRARQDQRKSVGSRGTQFERAISKLDDARLRIGRKSIMLWTVLEGWRIAPGASRGRKVRTPQGATPRNPILAIGIHAGSRFQGRPTDSATENRQPVQVLANQGVVMVKRCGKSAPREAQATRHGKPRRVQDQIGNPRSGPFQRRESGRIPGIGR